jgi:hypothetical protein
MPEDRVVTFRLPPEMLARLAEAARRRNCAPADLIRTALSGLLSADRASPVPTAAVISTIARSAITWHDLLRGLRQNGAVLRIDAGGMLWIHSWPSDRPLGPASLWDIDRNDLALRFGAPFPGASRATGLPVGTGAAEPSAQPPVAHPAAPSVMRPVAIPPAPLRTVA